VKYYLSFFILLMLSGIILISCDDTPNDHGGSNADIFPNHVGDTWTYEIHDSTAATYDTVVVTIVGTDTIGTNLKVRIWQYQYLSRTDSMIVEISGDTVNVYPISPDIYQTPYERYIFPLHVGDWWSSAILMDTTEVMGKGPVSTPAIDFDISYRIQRRWFFMDNAGAVDYWFAAYFGMVKIAIHRSTISGLHVEFWNLIDCRVDLPID
jgi:hypothetical protein